MSNAQVVATYGKQVQRILADSKTHFERVGVRQAGAVEAAFSTLIEAGVEDAPSGSSLDTSLHKSMMATANGAFKSLRKAGFQAVETAEANYDSVTK